MKKLLLGAMLATLTVTAAPVMAKPDRNGQSSSATRIAGPISAMPIEMITGTMPTSGAPTGITAVTLGSESAPPSRITSVMTTTGSIRATAITSPTSITPIAA